MKKINISKILNHKKIKTTGLFLVLVVSLALFQVTLSTNRILAACPTVTGSYGSVTSNFNVSTDGKYSIWVRMKASSSSNNSVWLKIDNGCDVIVGDTAVSSSSWTWVNWLNGNTGSKLSQTMSAGSHSIKISGRESGVKVDKVVLTTQTSCIPTGYGTNCNEVVKSNPTNPITGSTTTGNNPISSTLNLSNNAATASETPIQTNGNLSINLDNNNDDGSNPIKIEVYIHGKLFMSNDGSEINLDTTKLRNGTYSLNIKAYYQSGLVKIYTRKIKVNNKLGLWKTIWYVITTPFYTINGIFVND